KGKNGEQVITYEVKYINGKEVERKEINSNVTKAVDEIIMVGTKVTEVKMEEEIEYIDFETKYEEDPTLEQGETKVKQVGVKGEITVKYETTYVNGKLINKIETERKVTKPAIEQIILIGTKSDILELNTPYVSSDNGMTVVMKNIEVVEE